MKCRILIIHCVEFAELESHNFVHISQYSLVRLNCHLIQCSDDTLLSPLKHMIVIIFALLFDQDIQQSKESEDNLV